MAKHLDEGTSDTGDSTDLLDNLHDVAFSNEHRRGPSKPWLFAGLGLCVLAACLGLIFTLGDGESKSDEKVRAAAAAQTSSVCDRFVEATAHPDMIIEARNVMPDTYDQLVATASTLRELSVEADEETLKASLATAASTYEGMASGVSNSDKQVARQAADHRDSMITFIVEQCAA